MWRLAAFVLICLAQTACGDLPARPSATAPASQNASQPARTVPPKVLLLPVDMRVHEISAGGVVEKVDAWSRQAADAAKAFLADFDAREPGMDLVPLGELSSESRAALDQHLALYEAVALTAYTARRSTDPGWRKRGETNAFTLGPGLRDFAAEAGADAALVIIGSDYVSSGGRKAAMVLSGLLGGLLGAGVVPGSGQSFVSAGVFDLRSGDLLWFETHRSTSIDLNDTKALRNVLDGMFRSYPLERRTEDRGELR